MDKATEAHLDRLVMDGSITIGDRGNPRDIGIYIRSGAFLKFQNDLARGMAEQRRKHEKD